MVPNSRPWSLLGQSISYIIKLAPILWWALPSSLAAPHPELPNASIYDWIPDTTPTQAVPLDTPTAINQPLPDSFLPEKDLEEDSIHKLVADNLYAIPTQGRGCPRKIDANTIETVSKSYIAQVKEVYPGSNPNVSSNLLSLKGVQFFMSMETIEANFPEIGQSLFQYFDTP
ncbi:hypothetical protein DSO57_1002471 [Entomophthora muscae]|uniref:Uncharacterized protein n=1 Tax=Entomophthora muscae TaxID=34485 RepID=A0ACC2TXA1_9FUNG|nr:hypothetical protein DSO57_1002471 [Entomophthora muscae]